MSRPLGRARDGEFELDSGLDLHIDPPSLNQVGTAALAPIVLAPVSAASSDPRAWTCGAHRRAHIKDQCIWALDSLVLNIAEGCGQWPGAAWLHQLRRVGAMLFRMANPRD